MGNLFSTSSSSSKRKGPTITDVDKAILSMKTQRKKLADQQKLLEQRIDRHAELARELVNERKRDRAMIVLKKKKVTSKQLSQVEALVINLENMIANVETTKTQTKLFQVLQQGNDALKQLQKEVTVEDVQKLMDDTLEAKAYQEELNRVLGQELSDVDNEAVTAELDALEEVVMQQEVQEMPKAPEVPSPQAVKRAAAAEEEQQAEEEQEAGATEERKLQPLLAS